MAKRERQIAVVGGLALLGLLLASRKAKAEPGDPGTPGGPTPGTGDDDDIDPAIFNIPAIRFDPGVSPPTGPGFRPFEQPVAPPISLGDYENPDNYPTAGAFHQVEFGDTFFGESLGAGPGPIAARALYQAAFEAAKEVGGLDDDAAHSFARQVARGTGSSSRRVAYTDLIQCSGWNDFLYGTYGYGDKSHVSPHGRAIRLMPYHADNRERMTSGLPPIRNIRMGTPQDKRSGKGRAEDPAYSGALEYLWLPGLNLERLWDRKEVTTEGAAWADGSSVIQPPPEVANLGIDYVADPQVGEFGCLDGGLDFS